MIITDQQISSPMNWDMQASIPLGRLAPHTPHRLGTWRGGGGFWDSGKKSRGSQRINSALLMLQGPVWHLHVAPRVH